MAQQIPGALVYDSVSSSGARELFAGLPAGAMELALDYNVIFDDFIEVVNDQTNKWTTIIDTGCTAVVLADTENGVLRLLSDSGDNEGASIQKNETFKINLGKRMVFEARIKMHTAIDQDFFIGLAENHATDPEACIAAFRLGFQVNEGSANLLAKSGTGATASSEVAGAMADATYIRVGFVIKPDGQCDFYVNRIKTVSMNFSSLPTTEMTPTAYMIAGTTAAHYLDIDYIFCASER
jgi:hypothetical protein